MALKNVHYPRIDARREALGIPKQTFANKLGLSWESANKKLTGETEFSLTEVLIVADWWGLSLDELVGRTVPACPVLTMAPREAS